MKISANTPAWLMCAQDEARPMLRYAQVERLDAKTGVLLATNGYGVVGVPVEFEDPAEPTGLIHVTTLETIARYHKALRRSHPDREKLRLTILRDKPYIWSLAGELPRWHDGTDEGASFPDVWMVVPNAPRVLRSEQHVDSRNQMALDPHLYCRAADAVGFHSIGNKVAPSIVLYQPNRREPFVWASGWMETGRPIAPWICIMPFWAEDGDYL